MIVAVRHSRRLVAPIAATGRQSIVVALPARVWFCTRAEADPKGSSPASSGNGRLGPGAVIEEAVRNIVQEHIDKVQELSRSISHDDGAQHDMLNAIVASEVKRAVEALKAESSDGATIGTLIRRAKSEVVGKDDAAQPTLTSPPIDELQGLIRNLSEDVAKLQENVQYMSAKNGATGPPPEDHEARVRELSDAVAKVREEVHQLETTCASKEHVDSAVHKAMSIFSSENMWALVRDRVKEVASGFPQDTQPAASDVSEERLVGIVREVMRPLEEEMRTKTNTDQVLELARTRVTPEDRVVREELEQALKDNAAEAMQLFDAKLREALAPVMEELRSIPGGQELKNDVAKLSKEQHEELVKRVEKATDAQVEALLSTFSVTVQQAAEKAADAQRAAELALERASEHKIAATEQLRAEDVQQIVHDQVRAALGQQTTGDAALVAPAAPVPRSVGAVIMQFLGGSALVFVALCGIAAVPVAQEAFGGPSAGRASQRLKSAASA